MIKRILTLALLISTQNLNAMTLTSIADGKDTDPIWIDNKGKKQDESGNPYTAHCLASFCPDLVIKHNVMIQRVKPSAYGNIKIEPEGKLCLVQSTTTYIRDYQVQGNLINNGSIDVCTIVNNEIANPTYTTSRLFINGNFLNEKTSSEAVRPEIYVSPKENGYIKDFVGTQKGVFIDQSGYRANGLPNLTHYTSYIGSVPSMLSPSTIVDIKHHKGNSFINHLHSETASILSAENLNAEGKIVTITASALSYRFPSSRIRTNKIKAEKIIVNGDFDISILPAAEKIEVNASGIVDVLGNIYKELYVSNGSEVSLKSGSFNAYGSAVNDKISGSIINHGKLRIDVFIRGSFKNYGEFSYTRQKLNLHSIQMFDNMHLENHNPNQAFFISCFNSFTLTKEHYYNVNGYQMAGSCNFDIDHIVISDLYRIYPTVFNFKTNGTISFNEIKDRVYVDGAEKIFLDITQGKTFSGLLHSPNADIYVRNFRGHRSPVTTNTTAKNLFLENSIIQFSASVLLTGDVFIDESSTLVGPDFFGQNITANTIQNNGVLGTSKSIRAKVEGPGKKIEGLFWSDISGGFGIGKPITMTNQQAITAFEPLTRINKTMQEMIARISDPNLVISAVEGMSLQCANYFQKTAFDADSTEFFTDSPLSSGVRFTKSHLSYPVYLLEMQQTWNGTLPNFEELKSTIKNNKKIRKMAASALTDGFMLNFFNRIGVPNPEQCLKNAKDSTNYNKLINHIKSDPDGFSSFATLGKAEFIWNRNFDPESHDILNYVESELKKILTHPEVLIPYPDNKENELRQLIVEIKEFMNGQPISTKALNLSFELFNADLIIPIAEIIKNNEKNKAQKEIPNCFITLMQTGGFDGDLRAFDECNEVFLDLLTYKINLAGPLIERMLPSCSNDQPNTNVKPVDDIGQTCLAELENSVNAQNNSAIHQLPSEITQKGLIATKVILENSSRKLIDFANEFIKEMAANEKIFFELNTQIGLKIKKYESEILDFKETRINQYYNEYSNIRYSALDTQEYRAALTEKVAELRNARLKTFTEEYNTYVEHGFEVVNPIDDIKILIQLMRKVITVNISDASNKLINNIEQSKLSEDDNSKINMTINKELTATQDAINDYISNFIALEEHYSQIDFSNMKSTDFFILQRTNNQANIDLIRNNKPAALFDFLNWKWPL